MKTALLLMVHGSPRPESNADVFRVAAEVMRRGIYDPVIVSFMEINKPDIPTAVRQCAVHGAQRIIAVPYFLHTGKHVATDLPEILEQAHRQFPNVEILMSSFVGRSERVTDVLDERATEAVVEA